MLVLDSGGVGRLAEQTHEATALAISFKKRGIWPPVIPAAVLVECWTGFSGQDANVNRLLKTCDIKEALSPPLARRAAFLRSRARRGSAVDAIVIAFARPGDTVLTGDPGDLEALAGYADNVTVKCV